MRRRRRRDWSLLIVIVMGVLLALLGWQWLRFRASLRVLPPNVSVAGMDASGMAVEQVLAALEGAYAQPVQLSYQGQPVVLAPESVGFLWDREVTRAALEAVRERRNTFSGFLAYLLRRPSPPVEIMPAVQYSSERMNAFLARVAQQYDRPPQEPVPLPESLTFRSGRAGYTLDQEASRQRIEAALKSAVNREVELVVHTGEAPPLQMRHLEEMLKALLADFEGIPSIFIKDLQTGEELEINPDVAYAGMSVLKVAVMMETYRVLDQPPDGEQTRLLTETMSASGNFTANLLLRDVIGGGDVYQGVENLTASMRYLGLVNTFMATPYDDPTTPPTIVTPANARTDLNTNPDPHMQTTAREVGLMLEMIYQCSRGGGALMVAYPGAFTPEECQQMLKMMAADRTESMIEAGLPPGTKFARKHGWISDTHADAAIVFSPGGDFILVVYLYRPQWLEWDVSNPLIQRIATATYNYFNPK
ncbi:MAG: serine hydrolase [Anaerolineae bacterium]|nr:serine hydrolase [Anaerolineae bacterium]